MKKTIYAFAAAAALLSLGACSNSQKSCDKSDCKAQDQTFAGILPAADAAGVRYTLRLDYSNDSTDCCKGDYKLEQTYLEVDTTAADGYKNKDTFKSEGDFTVSSQDGKKYIKLVKEAKDSTVTVAESPMFFLCDTDSTITMVNDQLQPSENSALNYTLKLQK